MSSERLIKSLKSLLPIGLGVFLVVYSYLSTDETIRSQIYFYIRQANPLYVGLSLLFALLSHVSRAIRWNYLLRPLGYQTPLLSSFYFVMMAYFANLGIPRSGEVLRATSLRTYEKVPFEKGFGTIVTERIIDLVMLFIVIGVTLFLQTERLTTLMASNRKALIISVLVIIVAVAGLWLSIAVLKKSTSAIAQKSTRFLEGIQSGLLSVF
ncbi:MAG: lysylphosphatidylglycerol synthase transmembrane domain-containing protein, partial [Bacteroidetes bacterium]|nr:lysylphosphatidylglycerol synthase transmembrane domain-containing protein [Bacteroidota bacterium]